MKQRCRKENVYTQVNLVTIRKKKYDKKKEDDDEILFLFYMNILV